LDKGFIRPSTSP
jgi:hypothetical protein